MVQKSFPWTDGTGDGGSYAHSAFDDFFEKILQTDAADIEGVIFGDGDNLEVSGTSSPVTVGSGSAVVKGKIFISTDTEEVSIPTPTAATRIDRIVLRSDFTAQTIRIYRVAGTEGGSAPALTQTDGSIWEIPLAKVTITTSGAITVTDERSFCHFGTKVSSAMLDDEAVTAAKLASDVTGSGLTGGAGSALAVNVDNSTIEISSNTVRVKDAGITNAKLASDCKRLPGEIVLWYGTLGGSDGHRPVVSGVANENWHWCNGETVNGVVLPDSRDRFPMAAGSTYSKGATGGAATKNLAHTHYVNLTTSSPSEYSEVQTGAGNPVTVNHTHTVTGNTGSGGSSSQDIMPPWLGYYFIAYVGS